MLKYFLEALCGQEEPLLAFKGGKYVSMAPIPDSLGKEDGSQQGKQLEDQVLHTRGVFFIPFPEIPLLLRDPHAVFYFTF